MSNSVTNSTPGIKTTESCLLGQHSNVFFVDPWSLQSPHYQLIWWTFFWTPTAWSATYFKTSVQDPKVYDSLKITRGGAGSPSGYRWGLSSGNKRRPSISLSVLISFGYKSIFVLVAAEELKWGELRKPGLWTWHGGCTHSSQLLWLTQQGQASWKPQHRGWKRFRYPIPSWGASSSWRMLRLQVPFLCVEVATDMSCTTGWAHKHMHMGSTYWIWWIIKIKMRHEAGIFCLN